MQNLITSSPLIWGGLLAAMVALPILIHLINRMRHQTVEWAAMDFLLTSYKRNRNQIWLKQWMLLLARIAMLLLGLLLIGQISCQHNGLTRLAGTQTTHHYVLVDDSLSMSELHGGKTAINRASEVVVQLVDRIAGRENHRVTLVRFSKSRQRNDAIQPNEGDFDFNARVVDRATANELQQFATGIQATALRVDAKPALEKTQQRIEQSENETAVVYLLSDFRQNDWGPSESAQKNAALNTITQLEAQGATVNLIRCAQQASNHLAIVDLKPISSITVAGVPAMMEVHVRNIGNQAARQVQLQVDSAIYPDQQTNSSPVDSIEPKRVQLSSVLFDEIAAGETASRQFPVYVNQTGQHALQVSLPDDALLGDNRRWTVTNFSASEKVLIVDGSSDGSGSLLGLALAPGNLTGLQIQQANKAMLRDATKEQLQQFETIFLTDVDQLDPVAVNRLEEFASLGGGVVFFCGPKTNPTFYREKLFRDGQGLFPVPLVGSAVVDESLDKSVADLVPDAHPIFNAINNVENSLLSLVQIRKHFRVDEDWSANENESTSVIATIRGDKNKPLVAEKQFGKGTVIAVLTTAGTQWNNWLRNPTFPPTMLMLQNHVAAGRTTFEQRTVGWSQQIELPTAAFQPTVQIVIPTNEDGFARTSFSIKAKSKTNESDGTVNPVVVLGEDVNETASTGIYELWKTSRDQTSEVKRFAANVDNAESELAIVERGELQRAIAATNANVIDWDSFGTTRTSDRGGSLLRLLLLGLVVLFLVEQWLAFLNSYRMR